MQEINNLIKQQYKNITTSNQLFKIPNHKLNANKKNL